MSETSRLSMLDEHGGRKRIIPAEVKGKFRRRRTYVHFVLLTIFLALPWIQINGTQAVLLDISARRFELFGQIFLSHDSPLLFFIIAIVALTVMLTTALWGRVWCGWACPQTVFIDSIYQRIETLVEGNYLERRKLYNSEMSTEKFLKYSLKWFLFLIVSSLFSHSFIAYFAGSRHLIEMMWGSPQENWNYFLIVSGTTALVLFNFGWFREQFCIIMCPYGRFQSVLMDQQSISVVYDQQRGEPRKDAVTDNTKRGDCVSCNRCVQVCPTGIDIRNGIQMECIGCTACIDACDDIMRKVNKPAGLISYNVSTPHSKVKYFRPRIVAYLLLILICLFGLTFNLSTRDPFSIIVLRGTDAPYQLSPEGLVINHFKLNIHNQSHASQVFEVSLPDHILEQSIRLVQPSDRYEVAAGDSKEVHLFASFSAKVVDERGKVSLTFQIHEISQKGMRLIEVTGVGPYPSGK